MAGVVVLDRDDLLQLFEEHRANIVRELKGSLVGEEKIEYFNKKEAAKFMGISVSTLNSWARNKEYSFPEPRMAGGIVLYKRSELVDWVESRKVAKNAVA